MILELISLIFCFRAKNLAIFINWHLVSKNKFITILILLSVYILYIQYFVSKAQWCISNFTWVDFSKLPPKRITKTSLWFMLKSIFHIQPIIILKVKKNDSLGKSHLLTFRKQQGGRNSYWKHIPKAYNIFIWLWVNFHSFLSIFFSNIQVSISHIEVCPSFK